MDKLVQNIGIHSRTNKLGPDGQACKSHICGLLRRMTIHGGLQHCIGKEVSRFEQGQDDFIENIDDVPRNSQREEGKSLDARRSRERYARAPISE